MAKGTGVAHVLTSGYSNYWQLKYELDRWRYGWLEETLTLSCHVTLDGSSAKVSNKFRNLNYHRNRITRI